MFGCEAQPSVDIKFGPSPAEVVSPSQYANKLQTSLLHAFSAVRENLATAPRHLKDNYDKLVHGKTFQPGDLVWLHNTAVPTRQSRKIHCPWNGPQRVLRCLYKCTYRIQSLHTSSYIRSTCVNKLELTSTKVSILTCYNVQINTSKDERDPTTSEDKTDPIPALIPTSAYPNHTR